MPCNFRLSYRLEKEIMDTIAVIAHDRPEFLKICLEKLSKARGIESKRVCIFDDTGMNESVFEDSPLPAEYELTENNRYQNQWSFLNYLGDKFTYVILDDIAVTEDFFWWSEAVFNLFEPAFTVGTRLAANSAPYDNFGVFKSNRIFLDWGLCMGSKTAKNFSASPLAVDEVLHNWMLTNNQFAISPLVPRVHHIGLWGSNWAAEYPTGDKFKAAREIAERFDYETSLPSEFYLT